MFSSRADASGRKRVKWKYSRKVRFGPEAIVGVMIKETGLTRDDLRRKWTVQVEWSCEGGGARILSRGENIIMWKLKDASCPSFIQCKPCLKIILKSSREILDLAWR